MRKLPAVLLIFLLMTGCSYLPSGSVEDLLVAPRLNTKQDEVYQALEVLINPADMVYKYPQRGEYRSSFVFYDLNGNGNDEAIIFYAYSSEPNRIRALILAQQEDGSWAIANDIAGSGDQIDFVEFANMLDQEGSCLIIGWQNPTRTASSLGIFSFGRNGFREELQPQSYETYVLRDFDGDGLSEIVTLSRASRDGTWELSLIGRGLGGRIQVVDSTLLAQGTSDVLQVLPGTLPDSSGAVFIDEMIAGELYTEIVRIQDFTLTAVVSEQGEVPEAFEQTRRDYTDNSALCRSLDNNDHIYLPLNESLPGESDGGEVAQVMLTHFMELGENGFEPTFSAVVNESLGYYLRFPQRWIGEVTVVQQPEVREWQFYSVDPDTALTDTELLRIRVYSVSDFLDRFAVADYERLRQSGLLEYYVYIPPTDDEALAVTITEVRDLLKLL